MVEFAARRASWIAPCGIFAVGLAWGCETGERASPPEPVPPEMQASDPGAREVGTSPPGGSTPLPSPEVAVGVSGGAVFPADWCSRLSDDPLTVECAAFGVVDAYSTAQYGSCRTNKLTVGLVNAELVSAWDTYLWTYTLGMAGCDLPEPLPGGILEFGPANIAAIGLTRPPLGHDDAELLIQQYLDAFAGGLGLTDAERGAVEIFLWNSAASQIDDAAVSTLSTCEQDSAGK